MVRSGMVKVISLYSANGRKIAQPRRKVIFHLLSTIPLLAIVQFMIFKFTIRDQDYSANDSAALPEIRISNAMAKIPDGKSSQIETMKILEKLVDLISGEGEGYSHSYASNKSGSEINPGKEGKPVVTAKLRPPRFVFGHSTGHAGSTTTHRALRSPGCPWENFKGNNFEDRLVRRQEEWTVDYPECNNTRTYLAPRIIKKLATYNRNTTYIDMGHFHNRLGTIECLADYFREDAAFVRIRRNRYDIARSFSHDFQTPCTKKKKGLKHPALAICPRSNENAGSVNLPVSDKIWDALTPFQRFLWYADEMEYRWHTMKAMYQDGRHESRSDHASPMFFEITWSSSEQLTKEIDKLRSTLGCCPVEIKKTQQHVQHPNHTKICALDIQQDFEYRRLMNYNDTTLKIIVSSQFPQHVDSEKCVESPEEIKQLTRFHAAEQGMAYDADAWVFPLEEAEVIE